MYIKNSDLRNLADGNTVSRVSNSLNELSSELEREGSIATQCFRGNFQEIRIDRKNQKIILKSFR